LAKKATVEFAQQLNLFFWWRRKLFSSRRFLGKRKKLRV